LVHERDERWAYVVLVLLAVAYVVYRFVLSAGADVFLDRLRSVDMGRFGKMLPYLAAPLFAVLSEVIRRGKARSVREMWENRSRAEGFVRGEDGLKVRFVEGGKGTMQGDIRLTRVALYLLDHSSRREPMRFVLARPSVGEPAVLDVSLRQGSSPEFWRVRVDVGDIGENRLAFEFETSEGEAWWVSLRRSMGRSTDRDEMTERQTVEEPV
jgi:hypothetical protein